jgi:uncharacterized membrane protein YfcA
VSSFLFATSGVETWLWLPPLAAFVVSFFSSMVGISGAFLLIPFQMSILGYVGPSVSATNLVFNLYATPGGVWRYAREGRMAWPLAGLIILGTLPGVALGFYLRTRWLLDPAHFKLFVGVVLLYLAWRLFRPLRRPPSPAAGSTHAALLPTGTTGRRMALRLGDTVYPFSVPALLALALVVGIVGGAYGIGGGAIIAPFCVAVLGLPFQLVAGASLAGTFATSVIGVLVYSLLPLPDGASAAPDWALGSLFGLGGLVGMYLGAATQQRVPQRVLRLGLGLVLAVLGGSYLASPLI